MKTALFCLCFGLFALSLPRAEFTGEAQLRVAHAQALLGQEPRSTAPIESPAEALLLVPAVWIGRALFSGAGLSGRLAAEATSSLFAALVCVLFFAGSRRRGASPKAALLATLGLAFASNLFVHARLPDGSALAALLLLCALEGAERPRWPGALLAGLAAGALAWVDPLAWPAAALICASAVAKERSFSRAVAAFIPFSIAAAFALVRVSAGGSLGAGSLVQGLDGLLLSTGKSVFLYSPLLFLGCCYFPWWWRQRRGDALLLLGVLAALIFEAAHQTSWHGDPTWGPRRLLVALPVALLPLGPWLDELAKQGRRRLRLLVAALALAGLAVQALGAAFAPAAYLTLASEVKSSTGAAGWFAREPDQCHFIPQFSPLLGHVWMLSHLVQGDRDLADHVPWTLIDPGRPRFDSRAAALVKLDWWLLDARPASAGLGLGLCLAMAGAGAFAIRRRLRAKS